MDAIPPRFPREFEGLYRNANSTNLLSRTIYTFNLDDNVLSIEDIDMIHVGSSSNGFRLESGDSLLLKHIYQQPKIKNISFLKLKEPAYAVNSLLHADRVDGIAFTQPRYKSALGIVLNAVSSVAFPTGTTHALDLQYDVDMIGESDCSFYAGAIQPTDYEGIKKRLEIECVAKLIEIHLWSAHRPFTAWFYKGSQVIHHPDPYLSTLQDNGVHKVRWQMAEEVTDDRAKYFSVFANTGGRHHG